MPKFDNKEYKLRKLKSQKNLASVGLGVAFAVAAAYGGGEASANELDKQDPAAASQTTHDKEQSSEGTVNVTVSAESKLDSAIKTAELSGIKVVETEKDVKTTSNAAEAAKAKDEANKELAEDADGIIRITNEHNKKVADVKTQNLENQKKFEAELAKYNKELKEVKDFNAAELAKYNKAVEEIKLKNAQIAKQNTDNAKAYEKALADHKAKVASIVKENQERRAAWEKEKSEIEKKNAAEKERIDKENKAKQEKHAAELKAFDVAIKAHEATVAKTNADFTKKLEEVRKFNEEVKKFNQKAEEDFKRLDEAFKKEKDRIEKSNGEKDARYTKALEEVKKHNEWVKSENAKRQSEYNKLKSEFDVAKSNHDKATQDYQRKLDEANKKFERENAEYLNKKSTYDQKMIKYEQDKKNAEAIRIQIENEFNRANDAAKNAPTYTGTGYTSSNNVTHLKAKQVGNIQAVSSGSITSPEILIKGGVDTSKVVKSIMWNSNSSLQDLNGNRVTKVHTAAGAAGDQTGVQLLEVNSGSWYKLTNAVSMLDGTLKDAYIRYTADQSSFVASQKNGKVGIGRNSDGSIQAHNYKTGSTIRSSSTPPKDNLQMSIRVGSLDSNEQYYFASVISDIDVAQRMSFGGNSKILAVGGELKLDGENALRAYPKQVGDLKSTASAPRGMAIVMNHTNEFTSTVANTPENMRGIAVARADFGTGAQVNFRYVEETPHPGQPPQPPVKDKPTPPSPFDKKPPVLELLQMKPEPKPEPKETVPTPPVKTPPKTPQEEPKKPGTPQPPVKPQPPKLDTFNPKPIPEEPKPIPQPPTPTPPGVVPPVQDVVKPPLKPEPKPPVKPQEKPVPTPPTIEYNREAVLSKIGVSEDVVNAENVSINQKVISKGTPANWTLKTETFAADREETTGIVFTNVVPDHYKVDLEKTKQLAPGFDVVQNGKTITFTATPTTLKTVNADLTKEFTLPVPVVAGTPEKAGKTYVNNFTLEVKTAKSNVGNVTVKYKDTHGNTIAKNVADTLDGKIGAQYNTTDFKPAEIAYKGSIYKLTKVEGKETGNVVKGETVVTYVYEKQPTKPGVGTVVVHYQDAAGNTIKVDSIDTKDGKVGADYDISELKTKEISHNGVKYTFDTVKSGSEKGKVVEGVTEITLVYKGDKPASSTGTVKAYSNTVQVKTANVTNWVEEGTNKTLKDESTGLFEDKEGDDIPGYKFVETKVDEDGNITNVYKQLETTWVDEEGNKLQDPKKGEHPDEEGDDIPGYQFIETKVDENGNVKNVYRKIEHSKGTPPPTVESPKLLTTKWVDVNGKELKDLSEGTLPDKEGDDIPGYKFVETKVDEEGHVTNIYKKLQTTWVDEEGKTLQDPKDGEFPDKEGDDIPGYIFVETKVDEEGNVQNIYRQVNTTWVDEEGNELKSPEKGAHPDEDKNDIEGYEFVETKVDEKGNVINVYRKVPAPEPEPQPEPTPEPPAPQPAPPAPEVPQPVQPAPAPQPAPVQPAPNYQAVARELPQTNTESNSGVAGAAAAATTAALLGIAAMRRKKQKDNQ